MILLVEMQCKDWEHNRVNSGIIKQIKAAFPSEKIKLCAENKHIVELKKILAKENIEIDCTEIDFDNWRQEDQKCKDNYAILLRQIVCDNSESHEVLLLSCNKGIVLACSEVARQYPDKTFHIILHAVAEEICRFPRRDFRKRVMECLVYLKKLRRQGELAISMKECMERCTSSNCRFIIFSPNYEEGLKGKLSDDTLKKITFLHHPFFDSTLEHKENIDDKVRVGIYGQAVNQNAADIIETYNKSYDNNTVVFQVMAKKGNEILNMKNVIRLFDKEYVTNEELEKAISDFDYILIPYSKNQYVVTASGIFCDAVSLERPLLMLNSPYLEFYSRYGIGIIINSIDSMAEELSRLYLQKKAEEYKEADRRLKKQSFNENVKKLKEELKIC